jgi:hypothetical protein
MLLLQFRTPHPARALMLRPESMCTSIVKDVCPFSGTKEDEDDVIGTAYGKGCLRKLKKICIRNKIPYVGHA